MTRKTEYEIGYRKPPKHTQFKKGQSGNPKGGRRRSTDVTALMTQLLSKRVVVRNGKTTKRMTRLEHLLTQLIEKARNGDPRLMKLALDETRKLEGRAGDDAPMEFEAADREVIRGVLARLKDDARP